jgi:hypothetical protein
MLIDTVTGSVKFRVPRQLSQEKTFRMSLLKTIPVQETVRKCVLVGEKVFLAKTTFKTVACYVRLYERLAGNVWQPAVGPKATAAGGRTQNRTGGTREATV